MPLTLAGYLWPSPENYAAWCAACVERMEPTHAEWVRRNERQLEQIAGQGITIERIDVDVADLVRWCRERGTPINTKARSAYAAFVLMGRQARDAGQTR